MLVSYSPIQLSIRKYEYEKDKVNQRGKNEKSKENLQEKNKEKTNLSKATRKRIKTRIAWLVWNSRLPFIEKNRPIREQTKNITFITLTIPGAIIKEHKQIKREALNRFIIYLKRKYEDLQYVWKAELQKRGQLHFHILINKRIPHELIYNQWLLCIRKFETVKAYEQENGTISRYMTDIHSMRKVNKISNYIIKYMSKSEETEKIEGRKWGASDNLMKEQDCKFELTKEIYEYLLYLADKKIIYRVENDYCISFYGEILPLLYSQGMLISPS
jgi:hypothetical protein